MSLELPEGRMGFFFGLAEIRMFSFQRFDEMKFRLDL